MPRGLFSVLAVALLAAAFALFTPEWAHADPLIFPYTAVQMTDLVNRIPNQYGLLNALNIFPSFGSISTLIEIRRERGLLNVLPSRDRGGPASVARRTPGDAIYLEIPHFPHDDFISPRDLQNLLTLLASGNALQARTVETELAQRLLAIRNKHAITREWLRMGALKGLITDGDGQQIYDLYDAFKIDKKVMFFDLDNASVDIDGKCNELYQYISTNLLGETMSYIEVIVSPRFFGKMKVHPKVQKYFLNTPEAVRLANDTRVVSGGQAGRVFEFGNIFWREYLGVAPMISGGQPVTVPFVAEGAGHARPVGTLSTFRTYDAPPEHIAYVNTPGVNVSKRH